VTDSRVTLTAFRGFKYLVMYCEFRGGVKGKHRVLFKMLPGHCLTEARTSAVYVTHDNRCPDRDPGSSMNTKRELTAVSFAGTANRRNPSSMVITSPLMRAHSVSRNCCRCVLNLVMAMKSHRPCAAFVCHALRIFLDVSCTHHAARTSSIVGIHKSAMKVADIENLLADCYFPGGVIAS
jgi:hypothetical protein